MVYVDFIIFGVSLIFLLKGSDYLVESAAKIAKAFNISEFAIGLSLVAIGTSIPELATSIAAIIQNNTDIVIGNVVGSNIANIGIVLAVAAIFSQLAIDKSIFYREGTFLLVMSLLTFIFSIDKKISFVEGIILLFFFLIFIVNLFKEREEKKARYEKYLGFFYSIKHLFVLDTYIKLVSKSRDFFNHNHFNYSINKGLKTEEKIRAGQILVYSLISILSIIAIAVGSHFLVVSAINIAAFFEISSTFIGLTMIAIGTSLPELTVTITSIKKHYGNILLGNIIGSNIANLLLILGISSLITPISTSNLELFYTMPFMLLMTIFLLIFIKSGEFIKRFQGIILLLSYIAFFIGLVFFV